MSLGGAAPTNEHDVEIEKERARWTFLMRLADGVVALCTVGAAAIPIWFLGTRVIEPLAGETTRAEIDLNVGVSLTFAFSAAINVLQWIKGSERKRTIRDQRDRMNRYEEMLALPPISERRQRGRRTL
jgi:hypothetical protein